MWIHYSTYVDVTFSGSKINYTNCCEVNHPNNSVSESSVSSCKISPTQDLIIIEGETSSITCTVTGPCQNLSNAYFHSPNASITDILKTSMFDEVHSDVSRTEDHTNDSCSFSIDLYWTQDEQIRSKLPSLQCVFTFKDGVLRPCTTGTISITFAGMNTVTYKTHDRMGSNLHSVVNLFHYNSCRAINRQIIVPITIIKQIMANSLAPQYCIVLWSCIAGIQ